MASNLLNKQPKKKVTNDLFKQNTENNTGIQTTENIEVNTYNKEEIPESPIEEVCVANENVASKTESVEEITGENDNGNKAEENTMLPELPQKEEPEKKENENQDIIPVYAYSEKEQSFIDRLAEIRDLIDNPKTIDKMKKRRKYTSDKRRNVTFSIRDDLAFLVDDLVDEAKIYKGLFQDEVLLLGIEAYIQKYGI